MANETIVLDYLINSSLYLYFSEAIHSLEILVGGIFGLYLILVLFKAYETFMLKFNLKKLNKNIKELRSQISHMEEINSKAESKRKNKKVTKQKKVIKK